MTLEIKCLLCKKPLENVDENGNQPYSGTEFYTQGHYGSTVTDHMDGTGYAVNICDDCLLLAGTQGLVLRTFPPEPVPLPKTRYAIWQVEIKIPEVKENG